MISRSRARYIVNQLLESSRHMWADKAYGVIDKHIVAMHIQRYHKLFADMVERLMTSEPKNGRKPMGLYIDQWTDGSYLPTKGKADALVERGATELHGEIKLHPHLVCVVENGMFDAAGWCFNAGELESFQYPDGRRRRWLLVPEVETLFPHAWKDFHGA